MDNNRDETFADTLKTMASGSINEQVTKEMGLLVQAMHREAQNGGKPKGKLTVTFSMKLDGGAFDTFVAVKRADPAKVQERVIMYGKPDGTLSENDYRQYQLNMGTPRDVSTAAATEVRSITDHRSAAANDK